MQPRLKAKSVAWLTAVVVCLACVSAAAQDAPPALPEALAQSAASLAQQVAGRSSVLVAPLPPDSLLDGYAGHMLRAHLENLGAQAREATHGPADFPEALPPRSLCILQQGRAALFVKCGAVEEQGKRFLQVAAYRPREGERTLFERTEFRLPQDISVLAEGKPQPPAARDKKWLDLFDRLFPPAGAAATQEASLRRAEADYFFQAGCWQQAAARYLEGAEPGPGRAYGRAVLCLQLAGLSGEARDRLQAALNTHPDNGPLYALGGWLMQRHDKTDDAHMLLEQARLVDMPREGLYLYARGLMALEADDPEKARASLTGAAELLPDRAFVQSAAARLLWSRGETEAAVAHADRAARSPNAGVENWMELAMMLDAVNDREGALDALREGFRRHTDSPIIGRRLAGRLRRDGELRDAASVLRETVEANACNPQLLVAHGEAAREMWRLGTAEERFRDAVRLSPDFPHARVQLAEALAARQDYEEAIAILRGLTGGEPPYVPAFIAQGTILGKLGLTDRATDLLSRAAKDPQQEVAARLALSDVLCDGSQPEEAIRNAQIAVAAHAGTATYAALARCFLAAGEVDKAESAAQSAAETNPEAPETHLALARIRLTQNRPEDTLQEAGSALDRAPFSVEALELEGEAHRQLGQYDQAAAAWQRALELDRWHSALHLSLARLLVAHLNDREAAREHYGRHRQLERTQKQARALVQNILSQEQTDDGMD